MYSHDQAKICKYLNTCLKRFEVTNRHTVKNVRAAKVDPVKISAQVEPEQPDGESETEE